MRDPQQFAISLQAVKKRFIVSLAAGLAAAFGVGFLIAVANYSDSPRNAIVQSAIEQRTLVAAVIVFSVVTLAVYVYISRREDRARNSRSTV